MAEHTPGPWTAQPIGRGAFGIWDGINRLVAETNNAASTCDRRPGSPVTRQAIEANARLIAQAPDMLAALRGAMQTTSHVSGHPEGTWCVGCGNYAPGSPGTDATISHDPDCWVPKARGAIAQAT